ncbi:hypothetical protein BDP67DRAFT_535112 [Colletotrichum lupini]|nr:hypothetical protein BDP67DRAFT_535112 [Colletotrichum lupini]
MQGPPAGSRKDKGVLKYAGTESKRKKRGRKRDAWCRVETEVLPHAGAWLSQAKHRQTDTCLESSIMPDDVPQGLKVRDGVKHAWKAKQCGCNLMRNVACPVEALPCFVGIGIGLIDDCPARVDNV